MKYRELTIDERINLKSWYKYFYPRPWALVSVIDTERAGDSHYKAWTQEPAR